MVAKMNPKTKTVFFEKYNPSYLITFGYSATSQRFDVEAVSFSWENEESDYRFV